MKKLLLATTFLLVAIPAKADTVLSLVGPTNQNIFGPQSNSQPCVIAASQCSNQTSIGWNEFSPNSGALFDRYSTDVAGGANVADGVQGIPYTVGQITNIVGTDFNVVIDVNTTSANSEVLNAFYVYDVTTGQTIAHYTGPTSIAPVFNNGNGFGDFSLQTVSFLGLASTDQILFRAQWCCAVDGGESFWLQSANPVPGPIVGAGLPGAVVALLGLFGLNRYRRRRVA